MYDISLLLSQYLLLRFVIRSTHQSMSITKTLSLELSGPMPTVEPIHQALHQEAFTPKTTSAVMVHN